MIDAGPILLIVAGCTLQAVPAAQRLFAGRRRRDAAAIARDLPYQPMPTASAEIDVLFARAAAALDALP